MNNCLPPAPSPQPPFLLCELGSLLPAGLSQEGDHSKNSNIHSLNKPGQRPCPLEGESSWSWDRKVGFTSKTLFSRESEITECHMFADFSSVTTLFNGQHRGRGSPGRVLRPHVPSGSCQTHQSIVSCGWPVTSQCFASVLPYPSLGFLSACYNFLDHLLGKPELVPPSGCDRADGPGPVVRPGSYLS